MQIHRIKLTNFKHFKNQSFTFKNGINALIGENNAGKTSLLYAIAGIFNLPFGGNLQLDFPSLLKKPPFTTQIELEVYLKQEEWFDLFKLREFDISFDDRLNGKTLLKITQKLEELEITVQLRLEIEVLRKEQRNLNWGNVPKDELNLIKALKSDFIQKTDIKNSEENNKLQRKLERYFHVVSNNFINRPQNFPFKPKIILPYLSEFQKSERFIGFNELQNNLRDDYKGSLIRSQLYHLKRQDNSLFHDFKERMESNFPIIEGVDIKLNDYTGNLDLMLDSYGRDITIFGGGTQTFAKIFSTISLEDVSIVLLDEPDSHIHANLANDLANYLLEIAKNKQIIFTTHLPNLIDSVSPDSIITVKLEKNYSVIEWIKEEHELYDQMELMGLSPTNYQLAMLNRAELIVCVEGPTDIEILGEFIAKFAQFEHNEIHMDKKIEFLPIGKLYSSDLNKLSHSFFQALRGKPLIYIRDRDEDSCDELDRLNAFETFPVQVWDYRQIESYLIDFDALTQIIIKKTTGPDLTEISIRERLESIVESVKNEQFSKLIFDYTNNTFRESFLSPDRNIVLSPNESDEVIIESITQALIARVAIRQFGSLIESSIRESILDYKNRWGSNSLHMVNAKDLLSAIRRDFNVSFQNKEIIQYLDSIPQEIHQLLTEMIFY